MGTRPPVESFVNGHVDRSHDRPPTGAVYMPPFLQAEARHAESRLATLQHRLRTEVLAGCD